MTKCICDMNTNRCLLLGYIALDSGPLFCIYRKGQVSENKFYLLFVMIE